MSSSKGKISTNKSLGTFGSLKHYLLWPLIAIVPIVLSTNNLYQKVFPREWYDMEPRDFWNVKGLRPSPLGLSLGLLAVVVGQIFVLLYFFQRKAGNMGPTTDIQKEGARSYVLSEGLSTHLGKPEGFALLGTYLIGTWMTGLMPSTYYSFSGGINWFHVILQLLVQDFFQTIMHYVEHQTSPLIYQYSHKPHHRFTNPRLFDAFNGSFADTFFMILCPLFITSRIVHTNVWSYMAFGSLLANGLTLIHSEFSHPWDSLFHLLGVGTAADHHVHHRLFTANYGHWFM